MIHKHNEICGDQVDIKDVTWINSNWLLMDADGPNFKSRTACING